MHSRHLATLASVFQKLTDPRKKRGIRHPFAGLLAIVFLGTLAGMTEIAVMRRWAKRHWKTLQVPLGFNRSTPAETTFSRTLAAFSIEEFQIIFAEFLHALLAEDHDFLVGAVDGKTACQTRDADGEPLHMLNVFVHDVKVNLVQYSVRGDKTNEPGCLKAHAAELFAQYPLLKLLTGDAIFLQRPLLEVLQQHGCDYLFQLKENQGDAFEAVEYCFKNSEATQPDAETIEKKVVVSTSANFGAMMKPPIGCVKR